MSTGSGAPGSGPGAREDLRDVPAVTPVTPASPVNRERDASHHLLQVTERELQRILLDIHDGPVQYMYAALSQLDLLTRALAADTASSEVPERAERIRDLLESGLREIRSFLGAFRPPEFVTRDLGSLLEGLALQHEAATDTSVTLDVRGELPVIPATLKIALYRVLQEALSNSYRHGGAHRVIVQLTVTAAEGGERSLFVEIRDNGSGFDPSVPGVEGHFGLDGMRDRVEMIGGRLTLHSAPGAGTTVTAVIPLG